MGRKTSHDDLVRIIGTLRDEIPDIALRTTLITGFPGETEEQHRNLLAFVREVKFDRLGVFTYSREEGTPAAEMDGQISDDVKERRRGEIMEAQQKVSKENGKKRIGTSMEVEIEGYMAADEVYAGRTYADTPGVDGYCFVKSDDALESGDFVTVRITGATEYDLVGEAQYDEGEEL